MGLGWEEFKRNRDGFDLYCSTYTSQAYNQVCIGIKKKIGKSGYKLISVEGNDVCDITVPEYLQVNIEIENKQLSIIGTRIKTQGGKKAEQFQYIRHVLENNDLFCCLGDFNVQYTAMKNELSSVAEIYGPRIINGYYSYVCENGDKIELDWFLSKGLEKVFNGYRDKKNSPYVTIDWSFVNTQNGYGSKTKSDYIDIKGLPDHGILKGMLVL